MHIMITMNIIEDENCGHDHHHHDHDHKHDHAHDHHGHDHHAHDDNAHYHDEDMDSISLSTDKPLNPAKFNDWINDVLAQKGEAILRSKGILNLADAGGAAMCSKPCT